jgi:dihydroflavonol-4-reductase
LVTGATGYVGTVLVKELHDAGHDVTSLAMEGDDTRFVEPYSAVRRADVCDMRALEREATGFDAIVHLAGIVEIGSRNRALMRRVNVGGTKNIARLCRDHGMKMLYCSSVHAMPCLPGRQTMRETRDFDPNKVKGLYGKTKAEATRAVLSMEGLDAMVAVPSCVIGPNERSLSNIGQLIVDFLCGGLKAYIDGNYNFVDVRDVAHGMRRMLENWQSGECYILSGHEISVKEMLCGIAQASGLRMPRVKLPYWFVLGTSYLAEAYYRILRKRPLFTHYSMQTIRSNDRFSNQKAKSALGFANRPAQESLADMTRWMMDHFVTLVNGKYRPCAYRE